MSTPDLINGCFEFGGAIVLLQNVRAILKDKKYRGVRIPPIMFFASWGVWNLYYYPHLDQIYSFLGGCCIVLVNITWIGLMIFYRKN